MVFFRDIANVTMDMDDVESIGFKALGGVDNVVVDDLSGTDVVRGRDRPRRQRRSATAPPTT